MLLPIFTNICLHRRVVPAASADESLESAPYKLRRRNSETLRAQYINTKELRCAGRRVKCEL